VNGIEAEGACLWTLSSTTVRRRNVADLNTIDSVSLASTIAAEYPGFVPTGVTVDAGWIYVAGYFWSDFGPTLYGAVCRLVNGQFSNHVFTNSTVKDLAFIGNRIFCVNGVELFYQLAQYEGDVAQSFHISGAKYDAKIWGIAYHNHRIYLCSVQAGGVTIYEAPYSP
jgi:hypothetical protein